MPLDSTETLTNAQGGKLDNETNAAFGSEKSVLSLNQETESWCYLFIHHKKVDVVKEILERKFRTFVHKSIIYKKENKAVKKEEQVTIAGLLFIQGKGADIQSFLSKNFINLHLVKDCSTKSIAIINHHVMQSFMQISAVHPTRIRFMPHPFDYYSAGNTLVRITSGPLAGMEGYRIRIAGNKCLISAIGGMTVAIEGIHKECFENIDKYIQQRKEQLQEKRRPSAISLTPVQIEIDNCFFTPENQLDMLAIIKNITPWLAKAKSSVKRKDFNGAAEIGLFILAETGNYFHTLYNTSQDSELKESEFICQSADQVLKSILNEVAVSTDLKEYIEVERQSLVIRFPFLPIEL